MEATLGCFGTAEVMKAASPERIIAAGWAQALPPVLVVQGTADANIPMPMIERFTATYRASPARSALRPSRASRTASPCSPAPRGSGPSPWTSSPGRSPPPCPDRAPAQAVTGTAWNKTPTEPVG